MNVIVKPEKLKGSINAISSKSYAHRALFCAALSKGENKIKIDILSDDIKSTINVLKEMGVNITKDKNIFTIIPPEKYKNNLILNVGESGTTLRFLIPTIAVLGLKVQIIRMGTLINRTNSVFFDILPEKGLNIYEKNESIYMESKIDSGEYTLDGDVSSQFISGLIIALSSLEKESVVIVKKTLESKPYVDMTVDVVNSFGAKVIEKDNRYLISGKYKNTNYNIENDWSNALFFLCAGIEVKGLNLDSKQADKASLEYLKDLGINNISDSEVLLRKTDMPKEIRIIDAKNMPDSVPILSMISATIKGFTKIINIKRLRLKESDRVKSTVEMLENLGVKVTLEEDCFYFNSVDKFKSCRINSYNDHRIAMTAAIASIYSKGNIEIIKAESVNKSYINFFDDFKSLGGKVDVL